MASKDNSTRVNSKRVFVSLCGKTLDMKVLAEQGHTVIGSECSGIACSDFFRENKIDGYYCEEVSSSPRIVKHSTTDPNYKIELYEADIFHLTPAIIGGKVDAVLDRAALVALPPSIIEDQYLPLVTSLMKPEGSKMLFASVSALPFPKAPPHAWETQQIERLLAKFFGKFELVEVYRYPVNAGEVVEPIYLLEEVRDGCGRA